MSNATRGCSAIAVTGKKATTNEKKNVRKRSIGRGLLCAGNGSRDPALTSAATAARTAASVVTGPIVELLKRVGQRFFFAPRRNRRGLHPAVKECPVLAISHA